MSLAATDERSDVVGRVRLDGDRHARRGVAGAIQGGIPGATRKGGADRAKATTSRARTGPAP